MRKIVLIIIVAVLFSVKLFAQGNKIVLVHPTKYNLELFTNLIDKKIIEIKDLNILGIYHEKETYDYKKSHDFLSQNNIKNIQLLEINEDLDPSKLYQDNPCSQVFNDIFQKTNGIIFFGGPDLPPAIYGEQMSLLTRMTDPYRHYFEASFLFHLLGGSQNKNYKPLLERNPGYTVYAICLGMQTMNIAAGGTMIQDIPSEVYNLKLVEKVLAAENNIQHRNYNNNLVNDSTLFSGNFHQINITKPNSIVGDYKSNLIPVIYSNHHQAIENLGMNLKVIATSMDGEIIEAIAHKKYPNVLGIQFHPEGKYLYDPKIQYRKNPNDELKSGKQILIDSNSYKFHLELWKVFTQKINSPNHIN